MEKWLNLTSFDSGARVHVNLAELTYIADLVDQEGSVLYFTSGAMLTVTEPWNTIVFAANEA